MVEKQIVEFHDTYPLARMLSLGKETAIHLVYVGKTSLLPDEIFQELEKSQKRKEFVLIYRTRVDNHIQPV